MHAQSRQISLAVARLHSLILAMVMVSLGTASRGQPCSWEQFEIEEPSARREHAMAFDSARGVTVMFGGYGRLGDTWEWDGEEWRLPNVIGPGPRTRHAMAYDSARGAVVLFGGLDGGARGDTWEWDGVEWRQVATSGPPPRSDHAMAYDSTRGVVVLFGGTDASGVRYLNDTWEWDGALWRNITNAGPVTRGFHALAYDSAREVTVLFGGHGPTRFDSSLADTWEWDGSEWTQRDVEGPTRRRQHTLIYDSARMETILFGGTGQGEETWAWDGVAWRQHLVSGPTARTFHAMAFDDRRQVGVLFGGFPSGPDSRELWEWNGSEWQDSSPRTPGDRSWHAMAYDSHRERTVLYGGAADGQTWEWDGAEWLRVSTDSAGNNGAMVFDANRGVTVRFAWASRNGETWEWDGLEWRLVTSTGPRARDGHAMAFDRARGMTVLFGGTDDPDKRQRLLGDTYEWDGNIWRGRFVNGPSARRDHAMAYDSRRGVTVLFGGWDGNFRADTWEWDGVAWKLAGAVGPQARIGHSLVYDESRGVCVLFGGWSWARLNDIWEYDGITWIQVAAEGPSARSYHAMTYHAQSGACLLHGGYDDVTSLGDTWEYRCAPSIRLSVAPTCPSGGPARVGWSGATPDGRIAVLFARDEGAVSIPPGNPCEGTRLGLGASQLQIAWLGRSDGNGGRILNANAPPAACGGFLQLLDLTACNTSNVAPIE